MAKGEVKFDFNANGAGVFRVTNAIKKEISSVKSHVQHELGGIKDALIAGLGIHAVSEMIGAALSFGKEIRRSADELGVTIDRAAQLKMVMESIGKDSDALVLAMGKVQKYMSDAMSDATKMDLLKKFGIGEEDFKDFNFDRVLRKYLEASKGMGQAQAQQMGNLLFGRGMGAALIFGREKLLKEPEETGLKAAQLIEISQLTAKFKHLREAIEILILKALIPFGEWLIKSKARKDDIAETYGQRFVEASQLFREKYGREPNKFNLETTGAIGEFKSMFASLGLADSEKILRKTLEDQFDKEIAEKVMRLTPVTKGVDAFTQSLKDAEEQAKREEEDRKGQGPILPTHGEKLGALSSGASNPFLQIGGLMGVDINYRIARAQESIERNTARTADAVEKLLVLNVGPSITPPVTPALPFFAGSSNVNINQPILNR